MADVNASNVVAGLIGGVAGSVLTFVGALSRDIRAERRLRRARLIALEAEIRWNHTIIRRLIDDNVMILGFGSGCWTDNYVALASDLSERLYTNLRLHYDAFARAAQAFDSVTRGEATEKDRVFLEWWAVQAKLMQFALVGELHPTWKLGASLLSLVKRIKRLLFGRRNEKAGGKGQEA